MAIEQNSEILASDIKTEFSNCVGYGISSKKISQFTSGTPKASDMILFEQDSVGKSATVENLGKAIGINMDLLWTNASPTSGFGAQTISINTSSYVGYYLILNVDENNYQRQSFFIKKDFNTSWFFFIARSSLAYRRLIIQENSFAFSDCRNYTSYDKWETSEVNIWGIPYKVYGVK